jgi:hypothetical protein
MKTSEVVKNAFVSLTVVGMLQKEVHLGCVFSATEYGEL